MTHSSKSRRARETELVTRAIQFAAQAHAGQRRKVRKTPYIWHPLAVGRMLTEAGCSVEAVAAGVLHDTVEDTPATLEELERLFGPEVARLVDYCTEPDDSVPWEERKQVLIEKLTGAPLEARLIAAADKIDNLSSLAEDHERWGESIWERFDRGRSSQEWYYRGVVRAILGGGIPKSAESTGWAPEGGKGGPVTGATEETSADPPSHPLFARLIRELDRVFGDER